MERNARALCPRVRVAGDSVRRLRGTSRVDPASEPSPVANDATPPHGRRLIAPLSTVASALCSDRAIVWVGGLRQVVEGASARLVPALLDRLRGGAREDTAVDDVASATGSPVTEVRRVLAVLWERGLVDEEDPAQRKIDLPSGELTAQARYLSLFTSRPFSAAARLRRSVVELIVPEELASRLHLGLASSGIGRVRVATESSDTAALDPLREDQPSLSVLAVRSPAEPRALAANDALVSGEKTFLAVCLNGGIARVGPLVIPRETACLRCAHEVERRLAPALPDDLHLPETPPAPCEPVALLDLVAALIVNECWKALSGLFVPVLANRRLLIEPGGLRFETEPLFKLPRCPACGRGARHAETEAFTPTTTPPASSED